MLAYNFFSPELPLFFVLFFASIRSFFLCIPLTSLPNLKANEYVT